MKKLLKSRKGEGYIDMCVGVVCFVMVLVVGYDYLVYDKKSGT